MEVAKPDERAVMTYVSCYYHAFSGQQKVISYLKENLFLKIFHKFPPLRISRKIPASLPDFPSILICINLATFELIQVIFACNNVLKKLLLSFSFNVSKLSSHFCLSDLVEVAKPDERSIMTYVAAFYHAFAGDQKVPSLFLRLFFSDLNFKFTILIIFRFLLHLYLYMKTLLSVIVLVSLLF